MKSMNMNKSAGMYAAPSADCTLAGPTQVQTGLLGGGFGQQSGGFALQRAGLGQQGSANNDCLVLTTLADGSLSLTAESAAGLIYMIEEEKRLGICTMPLQSRPAVWCLTGFQIQNRSILTACCWLPKRPGLMCRP